MGVEEESKWGKWDIKLSAQAKKHNEVVQRSELNCHHCPTQKYQRGKNIGGWNE